MDGSDRSTHEIETVGHKFNIWHIGSPHLGIDCDWQHVEQYAADVNLLDSDFFEGRSNLEGVYTALAYSLTDSIIGTFRYGYAQRINQSLGTGGNNPDLPVLNPIRNYHILQLDLTYRF